jgi:acyl carrier protein
MVPGARLLDDLGIDSLKVAELSLALEEAFDRPVFLGEILAGVEDPTAFTLGELAAALGRTER